MVSSHPSEPMVDECGLPDTGPCNDRNHVYILVCPCIIQESDILLSTKNIASGNGQSGYGHFLRPKCCLPFASDGSGSARGRLLQALTSDSMPCADSACNCGYRLQ